MSLILPLAEWPEADADMWDALQREGGPLDDRGRLVHLRATSLETLQLRYGRWLQWLSDSEPETLAQSPADRATPARLKAWLADLGHTAPMTRLMFVDGVLRVMRAVDPDRDWSVQMRLKAGLKRAAGRGDPARKAGRILSSGALLRAGRMLATEHVEAASTRLQAMTRLRDGTMIAMLALMPMRRRAFAGLTLGHSIHVDGEAILVSLPGELTKTGVPWEAEVPAQVAPLLRRYLAESRPFFMTRGEERHDVLWVMERGCAFEENYLGQRIGGLTLKLTGKRVPPHFFRDAAATTLARVSPQSARLIRPILAHSSFGTAERHYIHARSIEAGRDYATVLAEKKRNLR
ncbi:MAG: tyrosine-type recombinase/integrase [Paracoccaceae bacterium]